jgi:hypothetical protein
MKKNNGQQPRKCLHLPDHERWTTCTVANVLGPGSGSGSASPSGSFSGAFTASSSCVQVRVEGNLKLGFTKPPLGSLLLSFSACCTIPGLSLLSAFRWMETFFASVISTQSRRFLANPFLFGKEAIWCECIPLQQSASSKAGILKSSDCCFPIA